MFQLVLSKYKRRIYRIGAFRSTRDKILFSFLLFCDLVLMICIFLCPFYISSILGIIYIIISIIVLKCRKTITLETYQDNHIVALQKLLTEHQFDHIKWIDYFIDLCEDEKNHHKENTSILSLLSFFITASSFVIANRSFGGWEQLSQNEQWIAVILFLTILFTIGSTVICLKPLLEWFFFPQKNLIESFEEDLKYLKTLYQTGETKIRPR